MPMVVKGLIWAVVIVAAVLVLFLWVFPWVESLQQDPTIASVELHEVQAARAPR